MAHLFIGILFVMVFVESVGGFVVEGVVLDSGDDRWFAADDSCWLLNMIARVSFGLWAWVVYAWVGLSSLLLLGLGIRNPSGVNLKV